jgi:formylglycine-generating enzyme required for sulfatase activity
LKRQGRIDPWDDRCIDGGEAWRENIRAAIEGCQLALLLVSPAFIASDFIYTEELTRLLERRERDGMRVVPIILRPCAWKHEQPIESLQAWPEDGKAIITFAADDGSRDQAWTDIVERIARLAEQGPQTPTVGPPQATTEEPIALLLARLGRALAADTAGELDEPARQRILRHPPASLDDYRIARWAEWSQRRYAVDKRFTRLALLVDQGPEAQGARWQEQREFHDLRDVLKEVDDAAIVLLGPPGCGKSTLLRRLELDLAVAALSTPDEARISLFLPLSRYRARDGAALPSPRDWIAQEWQRPQHRQIPSLAEALGTGRFVLLLDAINEMPHSGEADYRERIERWSEFLADLVRDAPGTRVVFSCRSLDYSAPLSCQNKALPHVRVKALSDPQVEEFLRLYSPEHGAHLWRQLKGTPQLEVFRSPFFLRLLVDQPAADVLKSGRAALLTGIVRQALLREIEESKNPLFCPDGLLVQHDYERIVRREWAGTYELAANSALFGALSQFAARLQERCAAGNEARIRVKYAEALTLLGEATGENVLEAGAALQVLDIARDDVLFVHQLVQEYFAGRAIAAAPQPEHARVAWRCEEMTPPLAEVIEGLADSDPLPAAPTTGWEETFVLAAAMADAPDAFVGSIAEVNLPLAGRCAAQPDVSVSAPLRQQLQRQLIERSRDEGADLRARIAAARALGELGDPRFERCTGPEGEYLLLPTVAIQGGEYLIGSEEGHYDDEAPVHAVTLAPFALGMFPVTNAEWRLFMDSDGYEDERWWDTEAAKRWRRGEGTAEDAKKPHRDHRKWLQQDPGRVQQWLADKRITSRQAQDWEWYRDSSESDFERQLDEWIKPGRQTQPMHWDDPAYNHPAQPVVGVCWYEARAYCAWLSAQTGRDCRLPGEAEWEAAARGVSGRRYAWGDDFDAARCNTFETHVRGTTPIGVFPGGDTPEGLADMTGNAWDWTSSLDKRYRYVAQDGREEREADGPRVLRGGSWDGDRIGCRCASRGHDRPGGRGGGVGFRVCFAPPIK